MLTTASSEMLSGANRRLAAVAFVDVVGFSILMAQDEERTYIRWTELVDQVLRTHTATWNGHIIKSTGDGLLVDFPSIGNAVQWALAVQRVVGERNRAAAVEEPPFALRISVHLGDLIITGDDIYGDGVNLAARLQEVAEPGGVVLSEAAHDLVRGTLIRSARDLGLVSLKNYPAPVHAFALDPEIPNLAIPLGPDKGSAPSIAILPLQNLGDDPADRYLADGLVEDVVVSLANLRELVVIARGSALRIGHGADPREAGRALGVRYVMTGSIRRASGRLRLAVQLNDAETGGTLWAHSAEISPDDLFSLQEDIVQRIAAGIAPQVRAAELRRAFRKRPASFTAYDLTLRALDLMEKLNRDAHIEARKLLDQAMALDPHFSMPVAWAARWHSFMVGQGWSDPAVESAAAAELAARAVRLDPENALALATCGHLRSFLFRDCETALIYFDRALSRSPSSALSWLLSSLTLTYLGRPQQALRHAERAMMLSPCDQQLFYQCFALAFAHYASGAYEDALRWLRMSASANPQFTSMLKLMSALLVAVGRRDEAQETAARLMALEPRFSVSAFARRQPIQNQELKERIISHLRGCGFPE